VSTSFGTIVRGLTDHNSEIAGEYGSKPLYRNLGYFSLICLLRVHVLLGDPTRESRRAEGLDFY
jgi:translation initiation factor 3 subunit L